MPCPGLVGLEKRGISNFSYVTPRMALTNNNL
jgi:hypothetical protein